MLLRVKEFKKSHFAESMRSGSFLIILYFQILSIYLCICLMLSDPNIPYFNAIQYIFIILRLYNLLLIRFILNAYNLFLCSKS